MVLQLHVRGSLRIHNLCLLSSEKYCGSGVWLRTVHQEAYSKVQGHWFSRCDIEGVLYKQLQSDIGFVVKKVKEIYPCYCP